MSRRVRWISLSLLAVLAVMGVALWARRAEPQVQARLAASVAQEGDWSSFARAEGPAPMTFPADYGSHPDYQTEWWYYTGNLDTAEGRHFGYQFTIFRRAILPPTDRTPGRSDWATEQIYMGHFALTDATGQRYRAFERFSRGAARLAGAQAEPYRVWLEDWEVAEIGPGVTRLQAQAGNVALDLTLTDRKGPVLHGDQGYSRKGADPGNASYYYSLTRLDSQGTVEIDGRSFAVKGYSWKDHEYSTGALALNQIGWDWFAIQLDDNTELKVFHIRQEDGSVDPYSAGSFIRGDGTLIPLTLDDFQIEVLDTWRSPHSDAVYPARWAISVPALDMTLDVEPYLADQELNVSYAYWEGAVRVAGQRAGEAVEGDGYVELTGYAQSMQGQF